MKSILMSIAFLCWIFSYNICELFYKDDIEKWYDLRMILYSLSFTFLYSQNNYKPTKLSNSLNVIFAILVMEDLTDRLFFNTQIYEINDIFALLLGLYLAKKQYDRN